MKASRIMLMSNLIDELENIGFRVIVSNYNIQLSDEGNRVDITEVFEEELESLMKNDFAVNSFSKVINESSTNLEAYFINELDGRGYYNL